MTNALQLTEDKIIPVTDRNGGVGATPSTGRRRRGGRAFDGQWVAWASRVCGAERRALCDAACEIMLTWNLALGLATCNLELGTVCRVNTCNYNTVHTQALS